MENKKLNLIAGILTLIFIFTLFSSMGRVKKYYKKTKKFPETQILPEGKVSSTSEKELEVYFAQLGLARNPFILDGKISKWKETMEEKREGLHLSAIVWDEIKPLAIINNQVVSVGENLENYEIISIEKDKVIVKKGEETIALTIENK
ncbi:MAG: hypothetical protein NC898_03740 [Candidatus Omnitrophica bacterium]|nr:hypothetical protein [Candidatus Omnitrophota bacterium]MCM8793562.1 hypothetical protein [Candidatus Omnitrophota bacterium]